MSHNTLENYYRTIFALTHLNKYSISDLENLICFELDIYVELIRAHNKKLEEEAAANKGIMFG